MNPAEIDAIREALRCVGDPSEGEVYLRRLLVALDTLGWYLTPKGSQICRDCKAYTPPYMVRNHVWNEAWPDYLELRRALKERHHDTWSEGRSHIFLCMSCLEKRLGRALMPADFDLELPINASIRQGLWMAKATDERPV